jgi:hypothetical protein
MAYQLLYTVRVCFVPDGAGPMSVPSAQSFAFSQEQTIIVPGGNSPSLANFNTAMTSSSSTPAAGSMAADLNTQISADLATIQAWATGGN